MLARADLALHAPIMLSERGEGAADSAIFSGVASADPQLAYPDGIDIVSDDARRNTAEQLRGVPLVSGEDHQAWAEAQARGEAYELTPLGSVIEADQDEAGAVRFAATVHGAKNIADVRRRPAVSVGYVARYRMDAQGRRVQAGRIVNHLCVAISRGRDSQARVRADGADMPTLAEMDLDALIAALVPRIVTAIMEARKTEIEPLVDAAKPADIAMPAGDMAELKAQADAAKARADAAEAKLSAIEKDQRKARAATLTAALTARGIKATGFDLARADAADIAAAESALLDHALASQPRADQWGEPKPIANAATTSPTYKIV